MRYLRIILMLAIAMCATACMYPVGVGSMGGAHYANDDYGVGYTGEVYIDFAPYYIFEEHGSEDIMHMRISYGRSMLPAKEDTIEDLFRNHFTASVIFKMPKSPAYFGIGGIIEIFNDADDFFDDDNDYAIVFTELGVGYPLEYGTVGMYGRYILGDGFNTFQMGLNLYFGLW